MTREELVKQKAHSLGQKCFPDKNNVWARANLEAQWVSQACIKMAEWEHKRLIGKACEWLNSVDMRMYVIADHTSSNINRFATNKFISDFRKAMEEK